MIKKLNFYLGAKTLILVALLLVGCNKDESVLNDYDLWGRLQNKGGTWALVEIETFDNSVSNPVSEITEPAVETIYHFYIRSYEISASIVEVATVNIYSDKNLVALFDCEAEKERVVFRANQIFGGTVYTVEENKPNKQIWTYTSDNTTTRITLKRCDCVVPGMNTSEVGG